MVIFSHKTPHFPGMLIFSYIQASDPSFFFLNLHSGSKNNVTHATRITFEHHWKPARYLYRAAVPSLFSRSRLHSRQCSVHLQAKEKILSFPSHVVRVSLVYAMSTVKWLRVFARYAHVVPTILTGLFYYLPTSIIVKTMQ